MLEQLTGKEMTKLTLDVILNNLYISFLTLYYKFNLIKSDPNDNKFLNYAVIANAKFIMTEDRHFDVLKECPFPRIEVIGLDLFLQSLI